MSVAPNSPIHLAHVSIVAVKMPFCAMGNVIIKNTFKGEAPSTRATLSSLVSTIPKLDCAPRIRKGAAMNSWASIAPLRVNSIFTPAEVRTPPTGDRGVRRRRRASPLTRGGTATGNSISVSITEMSRDFGVLANVYASGIPSRNAMEVAEVAEIILNFTADNTSEERENDIERAPKIRLTITRRTNKGYTMEMRGKILPNPQSFWTLSEFNFMISRNRCELITLPHFIVLQDMKYLMSSFRIWRI